MQLVPVGMQLVAVGMQLEPSLVVLEANDPSRVPMEPEPAVLETSGSIWILTWTLTCQLVK